VDMALCGDPHPIITCCSSPTWLVHVCVVKAAGTRKLRVEGKNQEISATSTNKRRVIRHTCYFFPEGGVGPVPKRGCLLTLAYYAFPR
jgi:hypothetical protein